MENLYISVCKEDIILDCINCIKAMEEQIEEQYEIINTVKKELQDLKTNGKTLDSSMDNHKQNQECGLSQAKLSIIKMLPNCLGFYKDRCKKCDCNHINMCKRIIRKDYENLPIAYLYKLYNLEFGSYPKSREEAVGKLNEI